MRRYVFLPEVTPLNVMQNATKRQHTRIIRARKSNPVNPFTPPIVNHNEPHV